MRYQLNTSKIKVLQEMHFPKTTNDVKFFLGFPGNYCIYIIFVKDFAAIAKPLMRFRRIQVELV